MICKISPTRQDIETISHSEMSCKKMYYLQNTSSCQVILFSSGEDFKTPRKNVFINAWLLEIISFQRFNKQFKTILRSWHVDFFQDLKHHLCCTLYTIDLHIHNFIVVVFNEISTILL